MTLDMPLELRLMLALTRARVKGTGLLMPYLKRFYLRKPRQSVIAEVLGFQMKLDPRELVDSMLLFRPYWWDPNELAYVEKRLKPGDVFLDVGANVGIYSLVASRRIGNSGAALSIEADPETFERLNENLRLNRADSVRAVNIGVSDKQETLRLGIDKHGNRGQNSFLREHDFGVDVACLPLLDILVSQKLSRVDMAKFDIEGFEFRVLSRFLADAPKSLWPRTVIIEFLAGWIDRSGGNVIELLERNGYRTELRHEDNHIMVLDP